MFNLHIFGTTALKPASALMKAENTAHPANLSQARPGQIVKISGFGKLNPAQLQHLQAYGLLPGRTVQVLAQHPVTIILLEQTELAFESQVSCQVFIEKTCQVNG